MVQKIFVGKIQKKFYENWWFWLFIFLICVTILSSIVADSLGSAAIEKGEYEIIVDVGDNYMSVLNAVEELQHQQCPDCNCECSPSRLSPYYEPFNWDESNWTLSWGNWRR